LAAGAKDIQFRELKDMISQLNTTIASQNQLIQSLQKTIAAGNNREANLQEQINYLTRKLFGTSSEKSKADFPNQFTLFDEQEEEQTSIVIEAETVVVKEHTRKAKTTNDEKLKGISVEEQVIDELSPEEKTCPVCGTELVPIGKEFDHQELKYIPAQVKVIKYYTTTYGCPECKQNAEKPYIIKTKAPDCLMKHSLASPSAVAWTMYQKYANGLPLYRQEKDWNQYGIELSRTTLANWIIYCSSHYFEPLYDYFHRELLQRNFLMADETRVQVLKEPERNPETDSYMWLYRSGEDGLPVIILYKYTETRAKYNASEFLTGYEGYLETDGYQGYNDLPGIKRCCCWSHVRRYFVDAVPKGKEYDFSQPAVQGVQFCDKLFHFEKVSRERGDSYTRRYNFRLQKEKPVLEAFWSWLAVQHPQKNSRMDKAVNYVRNRKQYLETYLEDGRCSFSNNLSENAIRPFTVGRKNWLFSDTPKGATASATVYTIIEMAKAHNLNIYKYLNYLLEHHLGENASDEQLSLLAPWNQDVIDGCSNN
jgi:transposase/uncharacterized coiled-coil protein SlyX